MVNTTARKAIEDIYPLSPMQQGMLFHSLYAPNSGAYVIQVSYELHGDLNIPAFEQAWQHLVDRHTVLRTAFVWDNLEKPLQVVGKQVKCPITHIDWRHYSNTEQQQELLILLEKQRQQGFNLSRASSMHITLIQLAPTIYQFVWSYHHLLLDGWSMPILLQEFLVIYSAYNQGEIPTLPIARPYRNYIAWLGQQDIKQAEEFWKQQLQGFTTPTQLNIGQSHQRLDNLSTHYIEQSIDLTIEQTQQLNIFAKQQQITLSTLVQAAFALLLSHYSGETDVLFGTVCAGRPTTLTEVESMVGMFVNTLPLRISTAPQQKLCDWLKKIQLQQVEIRQYDYSNLADIHRWSEIPRSTPLFETLVVFENYPVKPTLTQETLQIRNIQVTEQTNYPLTLYAVADSQLSLKLLYDSDRFNYECITQLLQQLETLLLNMLQTSPRHLQGRDEPSDEVARAGGTRAQQFPPYATGSPTTLNIEEESKYTIPSPQGNSVKGLGFSDNDNCCIGELTLLSPVQQQILADWNATAREIPNQSLYELIAYQAQLTPDATAIVFEQQRITYAELNESASQIAHYLQQLGIQKEARVGVYLERSPQLLIALLGILKVGGAYVPLDPIYPIERLRYTIKDAQMSLLLTQASLIDNVSDIVTAIDISCYYEGSGESQNIRDLENLTPRPHSFAGKGKKAYSPLLLAEQERSSNHLAYLIYTSGSTGKPKGVMVEMRALVNILTDLKQRLSIIPTDRLLAVTTIAFDIAALELFLPLIAGAQVILTRQTALADPSKIVDAIEQYQVTIMQATPATWRLLLASGWNGKSDLKILCGGEALDNALAQQLLSSNQEVWNLYGPTETTIWSAAKKLKVNESVTIGHPIANTQFYVLDKNLQPVSVGLPGELYIAGVGLARGYWQRPDLTAEKFLPNVASVRYKTGDRVRYLPNGDLEYLGRFDNQVKIRGYRIELGEIESVLQKHPAIAQAVVSVHQILSEERLVAYVVLLENELSNINVELREFLEKQLPIYMLPTAYVILEQIPLTPNGKVNRQALTAPSKISHASTGVKPQTQLEQKIADIWCQLLHIDGVGIHDNFFDLGGHSLLVIRMQGLLRNHLHQDVNLVDLFRYPTINSLAKHLTQTNNSTSLDGEVESRINQLQAGKQRLLQRRQQRMSN